MTLDHPRAGDTAGTPPAVVGFGGSRYPVDDDGVIQCPDDVADRLRAHYADLYDWYDGVATCEEVKADGEVCGRELPCPYHSDDDTTED